MEDPGGVFSIKYFVFGMENTVKRKSFVIPLDRGIQKLK